MVAVLSIVVPQPFLVDLKGVEKFLAAGVTFMAADISDMPKGMESVFQIWMLLSEFGDAIVECSFPGDGLGIQNAFDADSEPVSRSAPIAPERSEGVSHGLRCVRGDTWRKSHQRRAGYHG